MWLVFNLNSIIRLGLFAGSLQACFFSCILAFFLSGGDFSLTIVVPEIVVVFSESALAFPTVVVQFVPGVIIIIVFVA